MMSLREGKWVDGVFNPHVYELIPRLYSRHEYLGYADDYKWSVDSHMRDFRFPTSRRLAVERNSFGWAAGPFLYP